MLTLSHLINSTSTEGRSFKKYKVESLKTGSGSDSDGPYLQFTSLMSGGKDSKNPTLRKSVLKLYSDTVESAAYASVSCSCPYFRIRLATSLHSVGSTDLKVAGEAMPTKLKNLQKSALCPHLFQLANTVLLIGKENKDDKKDKKLKVNSKLRKLT